MSVSFWQQSARADVAAYDVIVVGGGIVGCSTAYWLRRRRSRLRVALVEAQSIGHGATGRNAGFLLQGTDTDYLTDIDTYGPHRARELWRFTRDNRNLIEHELRGQAFDLTARGSLLVAGSEHEDERLQNSVPPLRTIGAPVVYLSPKETNRRLGAEGFLGSLFVTSGAMVNPMQLVQHIASTSRAHVLEYHPVHGVYPEGDHYRLETAGGRRLEAGQVVLALGAYLPQLVPELAPYVRPVRAQMLATESADAQYIRVPAYTHAGEFYVRQVSSGEVLLGGARHRHEADEVGYDDVTTPSVQEDLEQYLYTHFPWARELAVERRWSGTMGFSPDRLPVVGTVPGQPGNFWAGGFTGHGMSYGFRMGKLLAALALGDTQPEGYELFTAARFDEKTLEEIETGEVSPAS